MILSLNIDHIATLRNARNSPYPSLIRAIEIAKEGGAEIITIHLREDRRHIKDKDAEEICASKILPINFEIAQTDEMIAKAIYLKPKFVCIVPEKRQEITTEGGLDLFVNSNKLKENIAKLQEYKIEVSLFIEPEEKSIIKAKELGANTIELHTGKFADFESIEDFKKLENASKIAKEVDLKIHAGHGLTFSSAPKVATIKAISTLHIGHFLITESVFLGLYEAVKKMKTLIV
jgi:pyridoxine 5-phosphate synthase